MAACIGHGSRHDALRAFERQRRLNGHVAGCGGLFLAIQTSSGNADIPQAGAYTLTALCLLLTFIYQRLILARFEPEA